jgi:hypothetical protein
MPRKAMQDEARRPGPQIILASSIPVTDELQRAPLMAELN